MLKLYDYFRSSAAFRVRIALHLKNLSFEVVPIHLVNNGGEQHSDEYRAINPQELVPALQVDNHIITQSLAIIEYLEETYPEPALLPKDPVLKAQARQFALTIAADIHPLNNLRVLQYLTNTLKISEEQKNRWYQHWIAQGFTALETCLHTNKTAKDFCFGDKPTLADICLVPQMYNAQRFNCDVTPYPTLLRIFANCEKLPAVIKARPS
jgi:maleylacetoacetate isomerase